MPKHKRKTSPWRTIPLAMVAVGLLQLLARTWRVRVVDGEKQRALRSTGQPFVLTLWHSQIFPLFWIYRGTGIRVLVSEHGDGQIIARAARWMGMGTIYGSSTRNGGRALLACVRELAAGNAVAITPDGPQGPKGSFSGGALVAAARSQAPLLFVAAAADRAWRLPTWDGLLIPKPFARVVVAYGGPEVVRTDTRDAGPYAAALDQLSAATQHTATTSA
ncbi:MAG TPA: lysophospholipid acyltransferase family protein [Gemmatimonadaceae bacterium]|nr:lysophospholipid acyltransferase family protein [Gemmatimonadaceae bacterium]